MELRWEGKVKGYLFLALGKDSPADFLGARLCCRDCALGVWYCLGEDTEPLSEFKPRGRVGWAVRTWKVTEWKHQQDGAF